MDDDAKTKEPRGKNEEGDAAEEETAAKAPRKKPKIVLLIAGVIVIAVVGVAGYLLFARSTEAGEVTDETIAQEGDTGDDARASRDQPSRKSRRGGDEPEVKGTDIFFTDFPAAIANLGPSENFDYIYLKYGFNLELGDQKVRAELSRKMPKIAALIDTILTGRKWDQVGTPRGRAALEQEVVDVVNEQLETGEVIACYFVTFVAQ